MLGLAVLEELRNMDRLEVEADLLKFPLAPPVELALELGAPVMDALVLLVAETGLNGLLKVPLNESVAEEEAPVEVRLERRPLEVALIGS